MKFITLILIVGMSFILNATPSNKLIDAICKVESNNGMYIVGDKGKAIGCLQIWKTVVDDIRDCPSEFDTDGGYGIDYGFHYMLLGMMIIEKEVDYSVTDEDGNEKSVTAKLTNRKEVLAALK